MYSREKSRKNHKNEPSFSSTLLDKIYRSIDENSEKHSYYCREDKEMTSFRRSSLVEKWMEKEFSDQNALPRRRRDSDLFPFSSSSTSTSTSSDSSGALSAFDNEFSCLSTVARLKPVRTGERNKQEDYCFLNKMEDDLMSSKSRALKIYANFKKAKQPISPGGRLTSFINSLFNNSNEKRSKNLETNKGLQVQDLKSLKASSSCLSASSFSRSCLTKYSPESKEKMRNGIQRTVRFSCGHKSMDYNEDSEKFGRPNSLAELKLSLRDKNREAGQIVLKGNPELGKIPNGGKYDEYDYEDDGMSDSSSDLFEIDHLSLFGSNRFCEELPVYETTHFNAIRAIS